MEDLFQWTTRQGVTISSPIPPNFNMPEFQDINELVFLRPQNFFAEEINNIIKKKGGITQGEISAIKNKPIDIHNIYCRDEEMPPNLTIFRANNCRLWYWPRFPVTIVEIEMKNACLTVVPNLSNLVACTILILNDGIIEDVVGPLPPNLEVLNLESCAMNRWTIGQNVPASLERVFFSNNPKNFVPHIVRHIAVIHRQRPQPRLQFQDHDAEPGIPAVNIAENTQNVHENGIQESTRKNILYLIQYKLKRLKPLQPSQNIIWQKYCDWLKTLETSSNPTSMINIFVGKGIYKKFTKNPTAQAVFEFITNSTVGEKLTRFLANPYSIFGTTFLEIVIRVIEKILDLNPDGEEGEKRKELFKRLTEEVNEGFDKCTNGMIVRLTNVFVGFDENIEMKATPETILGSRIPIILEKIRKEGGWEENNEPSEYWKKVIEEVISTFRETELESYKWNNWISDFVESYKESLQNEGYVQQNQIIKMNEDTFNKLDIKESFLADQIRIWVGLGNFEPAFF